MRHIIIYTLLFPAILSGQLVLNDQGIFEFQRIAELDTMTEKQIHERTLNWFAETFGSAKDVIHSTTDSKIAGTYVAAYKTGALYPPYSHRIFVDIKDGRARFTVNQVEPLVYYAARLEELSERGRRSGMRFVEYVGSEIAKVYDGYLAYMNTKEQW